MRFAPGTLISVFRRRTPSEAAADESAEQVKPQGKGRPTPKRREAEKRRRQPITAPKTRKEAYRRVRERQAGERTKAKKGMARGDDKYLPKRDRGPVRKLARDYVDSRRTIGSYLMYVLLAALLFSVVPVVIFKFLSFFIPPLLVIVLLGEGVLISRSVSKLAAERHPDQDRRGVGFYAAMRGMQIRRLRIPQARLKPGEQDKV